MEFLVVPPLVGSSSGSSSESSSSSTDTIITVDSSSIDSAISLANNYVSKQLNLSHCEVIIISEELAQKGISDYIYTLENDLQVRPNTYLVISRGDSKTFLENSTPVLETLTSKYYQIIPTAVEDTGYTDEVTLRNFFNNLNDSYRQTYAILGSVNQGKDSNQSDSLQNIEKDSTKAGETPRESKTHNIEMIGLAVFNGDVLVGELNATESISHLLLTNKLENCTISFPNPLDSTGSIDLKIQMDKDTKNKVEFINSSPYITSKVTIKARILSVTNNSDYLDDNNLKIIETYLNLYLEDQINEYLYKTSKVFHSDIVGFGKYAVENFSNLEDWNNYNWLDNYKNAFFQVEVDSKVKSPYLLLDS